MFMKKFSILFVSVLLTLFVLQSCEQDDAEPADNEIFMENIQFVPQNLTIEVGTTVTWINKDDVLHTVKEENDLFFSEDMESGDTFEYTFNEPGTYNIVCTIHPSMTGTITVTSSGS